MPLQSPAHSFPNVPSTIGELDESHAFGECLGSHCTITSVLSQQAYWSRVAPFLSHDWGIVSISLVGP